MKIKSVLIIGLALSLVGCSGKEQAAPVQESSAPVATAESAADEDTMGTTAFLEHMHHHASQLGQLDAALAMGSLNAAQRPAYWLAGHDEISGVPADWQAYIDGMRDGAKAVESAADIAEAQAAAERIEDSCRGCHTAAGLDVANMQLD